MSKLEDGYFYGDSNGNVRFVSYDSLGSGGLFFALIIVATVFLEKLGNFLIENQWIVFIPMLIAVVIRYLIYDKESSTKHKICNVVSDGLRTLGLYGVLIALFSKVLECHILDRLFVALGLGLLFAAAYVLINMSCKFFRRRQWLIAHFITSVATALVCLMIYLNQVANEEIALPSLSDILTDLLIGIAKIFGPEFLMSDSFSMLIPIVAIALTIPIILIPICIGVAIGKKINRETQAKFDAIGDDLKKHLPNDADEYSVSYNGIGYTDKHDETHFLSFEQLGYEAFPIEKETVTMHYITSMGNWILKNIVTDAKKYKVDISKEDLGHYRLRTYESIRRNTLKKW